ncbi:MAG: acyl-CoA dehydrogenase [Acidimicrobiia bacterium]|nr:acyl-CoA dehydrogenase [Acidimicrobiia bacterium]
MELDFTQDQEELRDGVRAMLAAECPMSLVREVVEDGVAADGLWKQMVELGWPALTIAEEYGGLGMGTIELAVVVEELGRAVAPGPYIPTVSQFAAIITEAGSVEQQARFLGGVAEGTLTGALALAESGVAYDPARVTASATRKGDDWQLQGVKNSVLGGGDSDEIAVVARVDGTTGDDGIGVFVVSRDALAITPITALDMSRSLATITLDGVVVPSDRVLGEPGPETAKAVRRAVEEAVVALALETVGVCQTILDVTLEYAKQREQFGVPIGSFQAIKHKFADMLVALERARATAYYAALTIAEDDDRRSLAASTAKVAAGDCERLLSKEGIQIHGGIGYTWEHDMHLFVRRAKTNSLLLGTGADHRARIADLLGV